MLLADGKTGLIPIASNTTLIFSHVSIPKKLIITTGANAIKWSYTLNVNVQSTYGGEVGQVLSAFVDAITITGQTTDNDQQKAIYEWFQSYMELAGLKAREQQAVKFEYPTRGWTFYIQPRLAGPLEYNRDKIAMPWTVVAEVVADNDANYLSAHTMSVMGESVAFDPTLYDVGFNVEQPDLQPNFGATLSDNFQSLLGAWATGDFAHWGFDALKDTTENKLAPDAKDIFEKAFGTDFISGKPDPVSTGAVGLGGPGDSGLSFSSSKLSGDQNKYANVLVAKTGLNPTVVAAWLYAEAGNGSTVTDYGHNWLNTSVKPGGQSYSGVKVVGTRGQFSKFSTAEDGGAEAGYWVNHFSNMAGIKASENKNDQAQLQAIIDSPWDSSHYNNGRNLNAAYATVKGSIRTVSAAASGTRGAVVQAAMSMLAQQTGYVYGGARPMSQWPKGKLPGTDCSGFVELAYRYGTNGNVKLDPMGPSNRYAGAFSGGMITSSNGQTIPVGSAQAGDLVVYGNEHVALFAENYQGPSTKLISHGGPPGAPPHYVTLLVENGAHGVGPTYRTFL